MHPNRAFAWDDREAMLAFLGNVSFASIFVDGPSVVHAPLVVHAPDRLRFHIAKGNRAARALDAKWALVSCVGPDAYVSPDWFGTPDQVPTWTYLAVEAEGPLRRLAEAELVEQLDRLSEAHEARLAPKPAWTRAKMSKQRFAGLLQAIAGYELAIEELRGTRKLGQNKSANEREGAAAGLAAAGRPELAALMRGTA
jgi:transcriptional regulator